jgi:hypothetical protein
MGPSIRREIRVLDQKKNIDIEKYLRKVPTGSVIMD